MRAVYGGLGVRALSLDFFEPGKPIPAESRVDPKAKKVEDELSAAEAELHTMIGETLWDRYEREAQDYLHGKVDWRRRVATWKAATF